MLTEPGLTYRKLFESMTDGLVSVDMDDRIQESNSAYRNMLGYSEEELRRLTRREITPERWHELDAQIVRDQILTRGYSDVYEKEYRRKNGTTFPVEMSCFLLRNDLGEPFGIGEIVRDITESSEREQTVREAGERLRAAR
jgi:PAS domain S-box-containing protein